MEPTLDSPQPDPSDASDPSTSPADPRGESRRPLPGVAIAAAAAVGIIAALALVFLSTGSEATPEGDDSLAALAFLTSDGSTSTLAEFQGEPLVVNFFASWCAPCRAELPDFQRVHVANGDAVTFLGVNHDLDEATWRSFVEETEVTYQTVFQPETEIFTSLGAAGMPTTAFLSPEGEVLHLHTGVMNAETLQDLIDEHLLEKT